jgi:precorrin-2 dehydrogenase/sirohydrochlorin ferrochelatase
MESCVIVDFPICLRLAGRPVLLVGGGTIAAARARALVQAGASLSVIAPSVCDEIRALAAAGGVSLRERPWKPGDVRGNEVVFTAIDDEDVSRRIAEEARASAVWINCADLPDLCDFTLPAVGRRGPITVAVSTAGQAPGIAAALRTRFVEAVGREPVWAARLSGWLRRRLRPGARRRDLLRSLLAFENFRGEWRKETFVRLRSELKALESANE